MRQVVSTPAAPRAVGPYSQAIRAGTFVFTAGQIAINPATGQLVEGDVAAQTRQVLQNLSEILKAGGSSLDLAVRTTVYLADMADFGAMNEVYATFFRGATPARSTVQAARLPKDAKVEIDVIALAAQ